MKNSTSKNAKDFAFEDIKAYMKKEQVLIEKENNNKKKTNKLKEKWNKIAVNKDTDG